MIDGRRGVTLWLLYQPGFHRLCFAFRRESVLLRHRGGIVEVMDLGEGIWERELVAWG